MDRTDPTSILYPTLGLGVSLLSPRLTGGGCHIFRSQTPVMAAPPGFFGLPVQMEPEVTRHYDESATMWLRRLTTVWVDQGGPQFVPYKFEAWYREDELGMEGPLRDALIPMGDDPTILRPAVYGGEVVDPDPMLELPSPGRSEIDGHEEGDAMDTDQEEDPEEQLED